jgi:hypothetical protein
MTIKRGERERESRKDTDGSKRGQIEILGEFIMTEYFGAMEN